MSVNPSGLNNFTYAKQGYNSVMGTINFGSNALSPGVLVPISTPTNELSNFSYELSPWNQYPQSPIYSPIGQPVSGYGDAYSQPFDINQEQQQEVIGQYASGSEQQGYYLTFQDAQNMESSSDNNIRNFGAAVAEAIDKGETMQSGEYTLVNGYDTPQTGTEYPPLNPNGSSVFTTNNGDTDLSDDAGYSQAGGDVTNTGFAALEQYNFPQNVSNPYSSPYPSPSPYPTYPTYPTGNQSVINVSAYQQFLQDSTPLPDNTNGSPGGIMTDHIDAPKYSLQSLQQTENNLIAEGGSSEEIAAGESLIQNFNTFANANVINSNGASNNTVSSLDITIIADNSGDGTAISTSDIQAEAAKEASGYNPYPTSPYNPPTYPTYPTYPTNPTYPTSPYGSDSIAVSSYNAFLNAATPSFSFEGATVGDQVQSSYSLQSVQTEEQKLIADGGPADEIAAGQELINNFSVFSNAEAPGLESVYINSGDIQAVADNSGDGTAISSSDIQVEQQKEYDINNGPGNHYG